MKLYGKTKKIIIGKIESTTKQKKTPIITYDISMGVIRMVDDSMVSNSSTSVSPIKLSQSMRDTIKKPILAKNV